MTSSILASFEELRADRSSDIAIHALSEGRHLSFEEISEESRFMAQILSKAGLPEGGALLSLTGNRASSLSLFLACLARRLVLVPMDGASKIDEARHLASRYQTCAIVGTETVIGSLAETDSGSDPRPIPGGLALLTSGGEGSRSYGGAVLLKLTSGSTGRPKAVLASERHLLNDAGHIVEAMGIGAEDVNLATIPLWHSYGLGNLVMPLLRQGTAIALRDTFVPLQFFQDVETSGATVFPGVPVLFESLLPFERSRRLPERLRLVLSAGARLERSLVEAFHASYGRKIHSFYGSSETGGISFDADEQLGEIPSVGRRLPHTRVTLIGEGNPGAGGRVHVSGSAVAEGYVAGDEDDGPAEFTGEGFLTGDLGRLDETGCLHLIGRVSSFVNIAGRKVDPAEPERIILEMPEVEAVKVLGLPCDKRGQKLVAFVASSRGTVNSLAVRRYCEERLSPHKIPRDFITLEKLPVNARGKTDCLALEGLAREPQT